MKKFPDLRSQKEIDRANRRAWVLQLLGDAVGFVAIVTIALAVYLLA